MTLVPFYRLHSERYAIYWQRYRTQTDWDKERQRLDENRLRALWAQAHTVDCVRPGDAAWEKEHLVEAAESDTGVVENGPWRSSADAYDTSGLFNPGFYADIKLPEDKWVIGSKPSDPNADTGTPYLNPAAFGPPPSTSSGALPTRFGTAGRFVDGLRGFATWSEDFSLLKKTDLKFREGAFFEIRMDASNIFNRTGINDPSTDASDPSSFGRVYGKYGGGRTIQVGARISF